MTHRGCSSARDKISGCLEMARHKRLAYVSRSRKKTVDFSTRLAFMHRSMQDRPNSVQIQNAQTKLKDTRRKREVARNDGDRASCKRETFYARVYHSLYTV